MPYFFKPLTRKGSRILLLTQLIVRGLRVVPFRGNRAVSFKSRSADFAASESSRDFQSPSDSSKNSARNKSKNCFSFFIPGHREFS